MSQPFTEYRGCVILVYSGLDPIRFGSPCTEYLRWTVDKVKDDIDVYRDGTPEPPPEEPADTFIETYREYEIWRRPDAGLFYSNMSATVTAIGETLALCRSSIDDYILILYPPEEPPDGLFAQIVANLKAWVLTNIQAWVTQWGKIVNNVTNYIDDSLNYWGDQVTQYIDNTITYWTEEITNVYNDLRNYVTNTYNYWTEEITEVYNTINEYVSNVTNVFQEYVTNNTYNTIQNITNIIGVLDPFGFLSDPQGYITGVWNMLIDPWAQDLIESFWKGLEEGLEE